MNYNINIGVSNGYEGIDWIEYRHGELVKGGENRHLFLILLEVLYISQNMKHDIQDIAIAIEQKNGTGYYIQMSDWSYTIRDFCELIKKGAIDLLALLKENTTTNTIKI